MKSTFYVIKNTASYKPEFHHLKLFTYYLMLLFIELKNNGMNATYVRRLSDQCLSCLATAIMHGTRHLAAIRQPKATAQSGLPMRLASESLPIEFQHQLSKSHHHNCFRKFIVPRFVTHISLRYTHEYIRCSDKQILCMYSRPSIDMTLKY